VIPWLERDATFPPLETALRNPNGLLAAGGDLSTERLLAAYKSYEVRFDTSFDAVVAACAGERPGQQGTWITAEMRRAYLRLFRLGHAHSVETWVDDNLAGGLYGVALSGVFFGESMFSTLRDTSKIALVALVHHCRAHGIGLIDCQMHTPHLASLGAREISRSNFSRRLAELVNYPHAVVNWKSAGFTNSPCHS